MSENPSANKSDFNWSLLTKLLYDAPEVQTFAIISSNDGRGLKYAYGKKYHLIKMSKKLNDISFYLICDISKEDAVKIGREFKKEYIIVGSKHIFGKNGCKYKGFIISKITLTKNDEFITGTLKYYINKSISFDPFEEKSGEDFNVPFFDWKLCDKKIDFNAINEIYFESEQNSGAQKQPLWKHLFYNVAPKLYTFSIFKNKKVNIDDSIIKDYGKIPHFDFNDDKLTLVPNISKTIALFIANKYSCDIIFGEFDYKNDVIVQLLDNSGSVIGNKRINLKDREIIYYDIHGVNFGLPFIDCAKNDNLLLNIDSNLIYLHDVCGDKTINELNAFVKSSLLEGNNNAKHRIEALGLSFNLLNKLYKYPQNADVVSAVG